MVLNFFASWCMPCLEEHPELLAFDAAHRAEGDAVLVSVTFDDKADDARAFFEEHGGAWPVIDDPENSIGVAYGVAQVPETFVIAPERHRRAAVRRRGHPGRARRRSSPSYEDGGPGRELARGARASAAAAGS